MSTPETRPYRSHLQPACLSCRRRKSRCKTDSSGSSQCLMCRAHGTECIYPIGNESNSRRIRRTQRRNVIDPQRTSAFAEQAEEGSANLGPRIDLGSRSSLNVVQSASQGEVVPAMSARSQGIDFVSNVFQESESGPVNHQTIESLEPHDTLSPDATRNPHIIGPATVSDNDVLFNYLSSMPNVSNSIGSIKRMAGAAMPSSGLGNRPVMFTTVQKRPVGISKNQDPAFLKFQIIEKLLEPYSHVLIKTYFEKANSCLPLLDEGSFFRQYDAARETISPTLLACLCANALIYWHQSPELRIQRCPDVRFIWNLAIETIYIDLQQSPSISTVTSVLLNMSGRPITSMIGNAMQLGSAIALCHSLGLNRNPNDWEISPAEKGLRKKLWWGVVIFSTWGSLSYGTPPQIQRVQYDVPMPDIEEVCPSQNVWPCENAQIYVALLGLTEVLSIYLEHIYRISGPDVNTPADLWHLDSLLLRWEENLVDSLRRVVLRGVDFKQPGSANLHLCYLSVKLLLKRIALDLNLDRMHADNSKLQAQRVAEDIVSLVSELRESQTGGFWLSVTAFSLASTAGFLIRRTLESRFEHTDLASNPSFKLIKQFISSLRAHRRDFHWDLGDICLSQYGQIVDDLEHNGVGSLETSLENVDVITLPNLNIDELFPSLWDMFEADANTVPQLSETL